MKLIYVLFIVALSGCNVTGESVNLCVRYCQDKGGVDYIHAALTNNFDACHCLDGSRIITNDTREKYNEE